MRAGQPEQQSSTAARKVEADAKEQEGKLIGKAGAEAVAAGAAATAAVPQLHAQARPVVPAGGEAETSADVDAARHRADQEQGEKQLAAPAVPPPVHVESDAPPHMLVTTASRAAPAGATAVQQAAAPEGEVLMAELAETPDAAEEEEEEAAEVGVGVELERAASGLDSRTEHGRGRDASDAGGAAESEAADEDREERAEEQQQQDGAEGDTPDDDVEEEEEEEEEEGLDDGEGLDHQAREAMDVLPPLDDDEDNEHVAVAPDVVLEGGGPGVSHVVAESVGAGTDSMTGGESAFGSSTYDGGSSTASKSKRRSIWWRAAHKVKKRLKAAVQKIKEATGSKPGSAAPSAAASAASSVPPSVAASVAASAAASVTSVRR